MKCEECREWLSPLIDRELESDVLSSMCGHLRDCPRCAQEFAELFCADAAARRIGDAPLPEDLWERIEQELPPIQRTQEHRQTPFPAKREGTTGNIVDFGEARTRLSRLGRI